MEVALDPVTRCERRRLDEIRIVVIDVLDELVVSDVSAPARLDVTVGEVDPERLAVVAAQQTRAVD